MALGPLPDDEDLDLAPGRTSRRRNRGYGLLDRGAPNGADHDRKLRSSLPASRCSHPPCTSTSDLRRARSVTIPPHARRSSSSRSRRSPEGGAAGKTAIGLLRGLVANGVDVHALAARQHFAPAGDVPAGLPVELVDVEPPGPWQARLGRLRRPRGELAAVRSRRASASAPPRSTSSTWRRPRRPGATRVSRCRRSSTCTTSCGATATSARPWSKQFREVLESRRGERAAIRRHRHLVASSPLVAEALRGGRAARGGRTSRRSRSTRRCTPPRRSTARPRRGSSAPRRGRRPPPRCATLVDRRLAARPASRRPSARLVVAGRGTGRARARRRRGRGLGEVGLAISSRGLSCCSSARPRQRDEGQGARGDGERRSCRDDRRRAPRGSSVRTASSCSTQPARAGRRLPSNCSTTRGHGGSAGRPRGPTSSAAMRRARRPSRSSSSTAEWRAEPAGARQAATSRSGRCEAPAGSKFPQRRALGRRSH